MRIWDCIGPDPYQGSQGLKAQPLCEAVRHDLKSCPDTSKCNPATKCALQIAALMALVLAGCNIGPKYKPPAPPAPPTFKESAPAAYKDALPGTWQPARPQDAE